MVLLKRFGFNQLTVGKSLVLLLLSVGLSILPFILIKETWRQTQTFRGINFPNGERSFADEVVSYEPGKLSQNQDNVTQNPNVIEPANALGIPNAQAPQFPFLPWSEKNYVSLGDRGKLTLKFTQKLLTVSQDQKPDLWIFTRQPIRGDLTVSISKDGKTWYDLGQVQSNGIDLDQLGWQKKDLFSYIRLVYNPRVQSSEGRIDIDAVGASSSVLIASDSPFFPSFLGIFILIGVSLVLGVSIGYFLKGTKKL
jgi:hypothetical protein